MKSFLTKKGKFRKSPFTSCMDADSAMISCGRDQRDLRLGIGSNEAVFKDVAACDGEYSQVFSSKGLRELAAALIEAADAMDKE